MIFRTTLAAAIISTAVGTAPAFAFGLAGAPLASAHSDLVQVAQKKKKSEVDRSIDNRTVPSRYRKDVPKQYQQYVPFEKGR